MIPRVFIQDESRCAARSKCYKIVSSLAFGTEREFLEPSAAFLLEFSESFGTESRKNHVLESVYYRAKLENNIYVRNHSRNGERSKANVSLPLPLSFLHSSSRTLREDDDHPN